MSAAKILVVEDEFITATDIQGHLEQMDFQVPAIVDNGPAAIEKAGELRPDLILMDITLNGDMTGIEAAEKIRERYHIPVVFLTAHSEEPTFERALRSSPYGYIIKPFDPINLRAIIEMSLYKHRMEETLLERERTISSLLNAIPDALVLLNRDKKIIAINDAMAEKVGRSRAELTGVPISDLIAAGSVGVSLEQFEGVLRKGTPVNVEEQHEGRWFQNAMFPISDPDGVVTQIALQSRDITDIREIKEQMKEERLADIVMSVDQCRILNDQIRRSLRAIREILTSGESPFTNQINEHVHLIDSHVSQLDHGFARAEKARHLLCEYYLLHEKTGHMQGKEVICEETQDSRDRGNGKDYPEN
jgi:PAS domain S-box-containing protein